MGARQSIERRGEAATLQRLVVGDDPIEVDLRAFIRGFTSHPLPQGLPQGTSIARISNAEIEAAAWPAPPKKGDRLVAGGQTRVVQAVETVRKAGVVEMYVLTLAGT